jgi:hypothetical protein
MEPIETIYYRLADGSPARGQILDDDEPESINPRENESCGAFMFTDSRDYVSPDPWKKAPQELADIIDACRDRHEGIRVGLVARYASIFCPDSVLFVGVLSNTREGVSMGEPDNTDDYYRGIIVATKSTVSETHGDYPISRAEAAELARWEVERYSAWTQNECYGWVVEVPGFPGADIEHDSEVLESCWGFIGMSEWSYMRGEMDAAAGEGAQRIERDEYEALCKATRHEATGTGWPR